MKPRTPECLDKTHKRRDTQEVGRHLAASSIPRLRCEITVGLNRGSRSQMTLFSRPPTVSLSLTSPAETLAVRWQDRRIYRTRSEKGVRSQKDIMKTAAFLLVLLAFLSAKAVAQVPQNGKLQLHFMDVGQGDGALLISPEGE